MNYSNGQISLCARTAFKKVYVMDLTIATIK